MSQLAKPTEIDLMIGKMQSTIEKTIAADCDFYRFARAASNAIRLGGNYMAKAILDAPWALETALTDAARMGLSVSSPAGEAYLIARYNSNLKKTVIELQIGYRGYERLLRKCGVTRIVTQCVYENDLFSVEMGSEQRIEHTPWMARQGEDRPTESGKMTCAYCIVFFDDGTSQIEVTGIEEIKKSAARSGNPKTKDPSPAWKLSFEMMARRVPFLRMQRWLPKPDEIRDIPAIDGGAEPYNIERMNYEEQSKSEESEPIAEIIGATNEPEEVEYE